MALIKCIECGHEVSDKASACPNCGCPIKKIPVCEECGLQIPNDVDACPNCGCPTQLKANSQTGIVKENKNNKILVWLLTAIVLCLICGGGYYFYNQIIRGNNEKHETQIDNDSILANGNSSNRKGVENSHSVESASSSQAEIDVKSHVAVSSNFQQNEIQRTERTSDKVSQKIDFKGVYRFDYTYDDRQPYIEVLEDGRCVFVDISGGKTYLGDVSPISPTAFCIKGKITEFQMAVNLYVNGKPNGHTSTGWENGKRDVHYYRWHPHNLVFDIAEGKLYTNTSTYRNRDIEDASYTLMTRSLN